ncbi:hypothetical protein K488DRAFT_92179 [Vararia minispora EC-137]|uniref:Uncharacterized protein n=1 Tax=Vararia minispora EC-137 TaxID=1314806 RepID=A0ACB8Q4V8_9AGAM|nr:hypothetical protein K488DRAFT_92179 [Vararia minispora EC-137]
MPQASSTHPAPLSTGKISDCLIALQTLPSNDKLPVEILTYIFKLVCGAVVSEDSEVAKLPLSLTHICHKWRTVAFSIQSLWTAVDIYWPPPLRAHYQSLAGKAPLSLFLDLSQYKTVDAKHYSRLTSLTRPTLKCAHSLSIKLHPASYRYPTAKEGMATEGGEFAAAVFNLWAYPPPLLESLRLEFQPDWRPYGLIRAPFPHLHTLILRNVATQLVLSLTTTFPALRVLRLEHSNIGLASETQFRENPQSTLLALEELTLYGCLGIRWGRLDDDSRLIVPVDTRPAAFPTLRLLDISADVSTSWITYPQTAALAYTVCSPNMLAPPERKFPTTPRLQFMTASVDVRPGSGQDNYLDIVFSDHDPDTDDGRPRPPTLRFTLRNPVFVEHGVSSLGDSDFCIPAFAHLSALPLDLTSVRALRFGALVPRTEAKQALGIIHSCIQAFPRLQSTTFADVPAEWCAREALGRDRDKDILLNRLTT